MMWDTLYKNIILKKNGYFAHWVNLITIPRPQLALHSDHVDHCSKKKKQYFFRIKLSGSKKSIVKNK